MQRLEVSGAVRPIYGSLGVKRLIKYPRLNRSLDKSSVGFQSWYGRGREGKILRHAGKLTAEVQPIA